MNESMQVPVTWDRAARKKDKSVSLAFTTNFEITNDDFAKMDRFVGGIGWMLFKPNKSFEDEEIPEENAPEDGSKTKLQRLRAVYFVFWKTKTDMSEPFDMYWTRKFEILMDTVKEKLD